MDPQDRIPEEAIEEADRHQDKVALPLLIQTTLPISLPKGRAQNKVN